MGARSFSSVGAEGAQHKGAHCLPPRREGSPSGEGDSGPKRKLLGLQRHPGLSSAGQRSLCPLEASATCSPGCVLSGSSFPEPSPVKEPGSLHPGLTELRVILLGGAPGGSTTLTEVSLRVPWGRETTAVSQVCSGEGSALPFVTRAWSSPPPPLLSSTPRFVQDMTEYCWQGGAPISPGQANGVSGSVHRSSEAAEAGWPHTGNRLSRLTALDAEGPHSRAQAQGRWEGDHRGARGPLAKQEA